MTTTSRIAALAALVLLGSAPAVSQEIEGVIDLEQSIEQQIVQLEAQVGGDNRAQNQVVVLQWLIELYSALGRNADVERCYTRILAFFPSDVGTLNAYGRFLMDGVGDLERAQKVLQDAHEWARAIDARAVELGTTYQLRAELMRRMGKHERAVAMATTALDLIALERSGPALRTKAQSLVELQRYDEAADAYLRLIAIDRAADVDDINALKLFVSKSKYRSDSVQELIDTAVENHRRQYLARVELGGGSVVSFASADGVPLEGTLRRTDGPGAVLFVHDAGSRRSVFTPYAQLLYIDQISSLAVDLRGHGGSRADSMLSYDGLSPYNREQLVDDVVAAFRHLQETLDLESERIAIVSAGQSCAVVEKALYRGRLRAPVVHLSPSFSDLDRELTTALAFHADTPTLMISASEDLNALRSISAFENSGDGEPRARFVRRVYRDAGHGVETLRRVPAALEGLQDWLRRTLGEG